MAFVLSFSELRRSFKPTILALNSLNIILEAVIEDVVDVSDAPDGDSIDPVDDALVVTHDDPERRWGRFNEVEGDDGVADDPVVGGHVVADFVGRGFEKGWRLRPRR